MPKVWNATTGQLAGRVLDDAGRRDEAVRYYVVGERAAVLPARSAAIAGQTHAPPVGRALFWDRAAWAHAKNGDADLCLRALDVASEALSHGDEDERPTWAYWVDGDEIEVMAGRCLTELDRPDQAAPLLLAAIKGYDVARVREVALYRSWLGEAYAKAGDVEQACDQAMRVLDAMQAVNSARVDGRVVVLRRALRPYADVPAVREVEERSQAVMKTA